MLLAFDTATPATVCGLLLADGTLLERRHEPGEGDRPGHTTSLLALCRELVGEAGAELHDVSRIGVGVGPGAFTGLRIGVATARALAQASGAAVAAVSSLQVLATGARQRPATAAHEGPVLAVLDARRGEAFVGAWDGEEQVVATAAVPPEALRALTRPGWLAVGNGAVRFRAELLTAGAEVPPDGDAVHKISARVLCALARTAPETDRERLLPDYVRAPDATPSASRKDAP